MYEFVYFAIFLFWNFLFFKKAFFLILLAKYFFFHAFFFRRFCCPVFLFVHLNISMELYVEFCAHIHREATSSSQTRSIPWYRFLLVFAFCTQSWFHFCCLHVFYVSLIFVFIFYPLPRSPRRYGMEVRISVRRPDINSYLWIQVKREKWHFFHVIFSSHASIWILYIYESELHNII